MEVWAAGVTYERSRAARMAESEQSADIYDRVYAAERPELFFKSAAWRVSGPGEPVSVRSDSSIDVPEPELAVVLNADGAATGYTICNDMSSRSIEGQNPLYLPQAKTYAGSCALGPWIVPAWELPDPYALTIELTISRDGEVAWAGTAATSTLHRKIDELAAWLFRENDFPAGAILSTGTSLVPELPFTLGRATRSASRSPGSTGPGQPRGAGQGRFAGGPARKSKIKFSLIERTRLTRSPSAASQSMAARPAHPPHFRSWSASGIPKAETAIMCPLVWSCRGKGSRLGAGLRALWQRNQ